MAVIPTPEQGKPILDFSEGTFDGSSYLFQSRNGATEHVSGDNVADYVNTSRIYNTLDTESKTPVGAINEINAKDASDIPYDNTASGLTATDVNAAIDEVKAATDSLFFERKYTASNVTINANSRKTLSQTDLSISAIAGYYPLAVRAINPITTGLAIAAFNAGGVGLVLTLYNVTNSAITASPEVTIIYVKEEFIGT